MEDNKNLSVADKNRNIKVPDINEEINNTKGLKRIMKKVIYKPFSWMFKPLLSYLQDNNAEVMLQLKEMNETVEQLTEELKDREKKFNSLARDIIRTKWRFVDYLASQNDNSDREIECGICRYKNKVKSFKTIEADCDFEGGHLVRYICPECGVIFGPLKFADLSEQEFDDDYVVHYSGFKEGDSTDKEIAAFMQLKPEKNKTYLNYGCGSWSSSIKALQDEGYVIYGYDPYSGDSKGNPFIVTERKELKKMRFDGIFSNNLLEHLPDPAQELIFMKSLLSNTSAKMAHSTGCYEYMFEYTRFHMYFFTGRSLDVLAENAGLTHGELIRDEKWEDFLCYVFSMKEDTINYLHQMYINFQEVELNEGKVIIKPGDIFHGPYIQLPKSEYKLRIDIALPDEINEIPLLITVGSGKAVILETVLKDGENLVDLVLTEVYKDMEFLVRNKTTDSEIIIKSLEMI